ncbi:VOC family protein [Rhizobium sp. 1AS11]|uniref:VOC family protein n=1 Tax=Rhizobium acaciae TaxID=2989736 RepID=UPI002222AC78|nr:VOC family protein [Rhizobium acaciae]MCW1411293.1 VOC family protein [Rhizobium acaciae]MCW1743295.1 VOC family protein [Rhizobium acaciae]
MILPTTNYNPQFDVTRASHVVLTVADISKSLEFYQEVIGLILTERDGKTAYLRGLEEDSHHSLTLELADSTGPQCSQLGFRVRDDEHIERAAHFFENAGLALSWVEVPHQRRTLRVRDPQGVPLEFCSGMTVQLRLHSRVDRHRGGCALRFDHTQVAVPDVRVAAEFYASFGFMISDFSYTPKGDMTSAFMHRKDNPHDIVFGSRRGPRLHHLAYVAEAQNLFRAGDVAASLGMARRVEFGPSRHGQDHAPFIYFRDPDGHRVELLGHPIQIMHFESEPIGRDVTDRAQFAPWGQLAPQEWLAEASTFPGEEVSEPVVPRTW